MPQSNNTTMQKSKRGRKGKRGPKGLALLPRVTQMPSSKRVLMTFAQQYTLAEPAAATGASYFFRLNSVYDPDATGVGFSSGGYATWSALFLNYKVHRVTARIQGAAECSNNSIAHIVVAPVSSQSVVPTNPNYWKLIPYARVYTVTSNLNGGKNVYNHAASYDNAAIARVTPAQYDVDMDWSGVVGSNPARMNYLMIGVNTVNSTTPGKAIYSIQLTFEVEWFNPIPMQA